MDSDDLWKWFIHENYTNSGFRGKLLSKEDLRELLLTGNANIWRYLVEHVRSFQHADFIRKNVLLYKYKHDFSLQLEMSRLHKAQTDIVNEKALKDFENRYLEPKVNFEKRDNTQIKKKIKELTVKREKFERETSSQQRKIEELKDLLSAVDEDILKTVTKLETLKEALKEVQYKQTVLKAYINHTELKIKRLQSIETEVNKYVSGLLCRNSSKKNELLISGNGKMQTALQKEVKELSKMCLDLIDETLRNKSLSQEQFERILEQKIVKNLADSSPAEFVRSLTEQSQVFYHQLKELNGKQDSTWMEDSSESSDSLGNLKDMVYELEEKHVYLEMQTKLKRDSCKHLKCEKEEIWNALKKKINAQFSSSTELMWSALESKAKLSGLSAHAAYLTKYLDDLKKKRKAHQQFKEQLEMMDYKLLDIKRSLEDCCKTIRILQKYYKDDLKYLGSIQEETKSCYDHSLEEVKQMISANLAVLKTEVPEEIKLFSNISLSPLLGVNLNGLSLSVKSLSIYSALHQGKEVNIHDIYQLYSALNYQFFQSPDVLLKNVAFIKQMYTINKATEIKVLDILSEYERFKNSEGDVVQLGDSYASFQKCKEEVNNTLIPHITNAIKKKGTFDKLVSEFNHSIEIWWTQPAYLQLPNKTLEKKNLSTWFKILAAASVKPKRK